MTVKSANAYRLDRLEYMRREALIEKTCKLDVFTAPGEVPDFSAYGIAADEPEPSPAELLKRAIANEEAGWSQCFKWIMRSR
jgi:hypothetical protein